MQATDFDSNTSIAWVARREHWGHGMLFVQNDINLNRTDTEYIAERGPCGLLQNGHDGVVRLPSLDANLGKADNHARSPLPWAAGNEQEPMATRLPSADLFSPGPSETPEPPSKSTHRF